MSPLSERRRMGGPYTFAVTLLLITPAILAFSAAGATRYELGFPASALWFIYSAGLYVGYAGVIAAASLTALEAYRREIARAFVWSMGIVVVIGLLLLLYAPYVYRNPWYASAHPSYLTEQF
jgi:hypothetical protein